MRTGELALILGLDSQTILNWIKRDELSRFFSQDASGKSGSTRRQYTDSDVLTINTIRWLRTVEGVTDWSRIADYLDTGERTRGFPENSISADPRLIPVPHAEQSVKAHEALARLEEANKQIEEYRKRIGDLEKKQTDDWIYFQKIRTEDRNHYEMKIEELNARIAELNLEIGQLGGKR